MCQSSKIDEKDVELLRNGSVHEFYHLKALITLEQVTTSAAEKRKNLSEQNYDGEGNWSDVVNFHCMQIESCHNCGSFSAMIEITRQVHHVLVLWQ